jgi:hypothetical protein
MILEFGIVGVFPHRPAKYPVFWYLSAILILKKMLFIKLKMSKL